MGDNNETAANFQKVLEGIQEMKSEIATVSGKLHVLERSLLHAGTNVSVDVQNLNTKLTRLESGIAALDTKVISMEHNIGRVQSILVGKEDTLNAASQVSQSPSCFQPTPPFKRKNSFYNNEYDDLEMKKRAATSAQMQPYVHDMRPLYEQVVDLNDKVTYKSIFPFEKESNGFLSEAMKEFTNTMANRQCGKFCFDCGLPLRTHRRGRIDCPITRCALELESNQTTPCTKCLLPHCKGPNECGHKYVLMLINVVCSKSMVNKIVKIRWSEFCKEDEELLNSFPQGLDMTSYECAAAMTSIYKRLYTDEKFRDCFWSAVNATGIFKRKFFGEVLDHNKISEGLLRLHSELKETHIEDV